MNKTVLSMAFAASTILASTVAHAAIVTFHFTSVGQDGYSTAVGSFSYDNAGNPQTLTPFGSGGDAQITDFIWTISSPSGGGNPNSALDGQTFILADLTDYYFSAPSDIPSFNSKIWFAANNLSYTVEAWLDTSVREPSFGVVFDNVPSGFSVPVPAAIWLLGIGCIGLFASEKCRKQTVVFSFRT